MIDYFDASALAALLLNQPLRPAVKVHIDTSDAAPIVSDFVMAETSSAVSRLLRMKTIDRVLAQALVGRLDEWVHGTGGATPLESSDVPEATLLVRRFDLKLRAPDALHLAICRRLQARLVTLDNTLTAAAHALDVPCINPAETSAL